jgi:toxin FitB
MILVDTNVWSELTRPAPDPAVKHWEARNASQLWLSTVVIGELFSGAHMLPDGKRKLSFLEGYDALIALHQDRILRFDEAAARRYGEVLAFLEKAGRNPTTTDAQIAAIALTHDMTLATRNVKDFAELGIELINPWDT